jgi:hypothetical protein
MTYSDNNKQAKVEMIQRILSETETRKSTHYKQFRRMKYWSSAINMAINGSNAISVCSLVLSFVPSDPHFVIVALVATTTSSFVSALSTSYDLETRVHSHQTSYLQYKDICRDMAARLFRNGLSSQDLDAMLTELNTRISLVDDSSLPIHISDSSVISNHGPKCTAASTSPPAVIIHVPPS